MTIPEMPGGGYFDNEETSGQFVTTTPNNPGSLTITKLDFDNYIVSGTFSFDLIDPYTGKTVEIREGRFDTFFTQ